MARAVKSFSYDTVEDRDLAIKIDALEHGELSEIVRQALRAFWATERTTASTDDVYRVLKRLERKLESGTVAPPQHADSDSDSDSDPGGDVAGTEDAALNLDAWTF